MSKLWPINHFPQLKLLEPGLKLLEGFTTHESNLACNSQVDAGYKKLLQKVESSSTFCNNICTCCTNSDLRQICFAASDVKPVMTWLPLNFIQSEVSSHATCNNLKSLRLRFQTVTIMCSLRSKHFRLVSEQRKTEEGDFRFWPREKWNESQKKKKETLTLTLTLTPSPLFYLRHFPRGLSPVVPHSLVLNRTETLASQATSCVKNKQAI